MNGWQAALAGGILIGASATLLLASTGRIAGISGIVDGALSASREERTWRLAFLAGLALAGAATMHAMKDSMPLPQPTLTPWVPLAGFLVGFGARMGGGCTSGHGVCGLGRLSARSFVAVLIFMTTAILTVYLMRHVWGA
jgi:uncharacterized membrane protein YedE/YeeE